MTRGLYEMSRLSDHIGVMDEGYWTPEIWIALLHQQLDAQTAVTQSHYLEADSVAQSGSHVVPLLRDLTLAVPSSPPRHLGKS